MRWGWLLPIGAIVVGSGILGLTYAFASIPLPSELELDSSAEVYDMNDDLIGTFTGEVRRFLIDTDKLKGYVGKAVIAAEDRDFYKHNGVSLRGIIRAAWANLTGGSIQQGGSTITQQYVKTAVLEDPSRTFTRKAKEAILAIKLERRYSKRQILGFYLNTIYLGRGAYGVEAAAREYFDKHATKLTLGEAAYLAGIIPSPESYQPDENPQGAIARRDRVLESMTDQGLISQVQADRASRGRVRLAKTRDDPRRQEAAYFMEWLRKDFLYPEYEGDLYTGGLKIYTTLDPAMQASAEESVAEILTQKNDPQAALVAATPKGEIRAFVGGRDFTNVKRARGFNYAADYPGRQAGSAFKPFTLLSAIQEGISPSSRFSGASPAYIESPCAGSNGLPPWEVENYGGGSYGTVTLDQATTNSINTVYAQLIHEVGPENVVDALEDLQFDRDDVPGAAREISPDCGLSLGVLDVTPLEMARAYAAFAGRGILPDIMPIRYIENARGECIKQYRPERDIDCEEEDRLGMKRVIEQNHADVVTQTLTHVVSGGTATVAALPGRSVAGKTGTTQNYGNAWFAGYVPQLVTVVWEGYEVEKSGGREVVPEMRACSDLVLCRPVHGYQVTGGGSPVSPAVIWRDFMLEATADLPVVPFATPTDLPDEVINPAPPTPTKSPKPKKTEEPEPEPSEPEPEPTLEPTPEPTPSQQPTPIITPTADDRPGEPPERRRRRRESS